MRNQLVQENLGLVRRVARQFVNRGLTFEDLVGEGNLGLIRAAQEYDASLGTRFSTYADYWIRDAIQSALANAVGTIRLPMNIAKLLDRWRRTEKVLSQRQGHPPTFEEVAAALDLDPPTQRLIDKARRVARVQKETAFRPGGPSRTLLMMDAGTTAEETLADREERESVSRRLERLEGTERMIVFLRYGLSGEPPMSFEKIAGRLGMTATEVQKVFSIAMRKLGRPSRTHDVGRGSTLESRVG
jgi:RNA polymerase primary sigma factor